MTGFRAKKSHGDSRRRRRAHDGAGIAVNPAWNIHGHHVEAPVVAGGQNVRGDAADIALQARAEKSVHHQGRILQQFRGQGFHGAVPAVRVGFGVAFQAIDGTQKTQTHEPATVFQMPGHDKTVAAVVSGAGQNRHGPGFRPSIGNLPNNRQTGGFHQRKSRNATIDC